MTVACFDDTVWLVLEFFSGDIEWTEKYREKTKHLERSLLPGQLVAINRLTLLLNGQESEFAPSSYTSTADLPYKARKVGSSLNTGKTSENSLTSQQRAMRDWMRHDVLGTPMKREDPQRCGLHHD